MKNVVLGIIGCLIVVYTAMLGLSVYNMTVRENQMEKSLSLALSGAMNRDVYKRQLESRVDAERMENDIYQALDVGILIRKRRNEDGVVYRLSLIHI